jgi:beta-N-acetylhexosaminidase
MGETTPVTPTHLVAIAAGLTLVSAGCAGAQTPRAPAASAATAVPSPSPSPQAPTHPHAAPAPARPRIVANFIPFGPRRKAEMAAYARRHYGLNTYRLTHPQVIVEHYTETPDFASTYNTFAPDVPDSELHELPNTCAHFVVDQGGTIHQLVSLSTMCRHTVGLNWTAIGIEMVGNSDSEILHRPRQLHASLALTRWLRCRFHVAIRNVIGHNESLSSPFHHERIAALRTQTHSDWVRADMQIYRADLRRLTCG